MKTINYNNPHVGCYVDESAGSADSCNERTIKFAQRYGFDDDGALEFESMESDDGTSEKLSEYADEAVDFLNEQETRSFMHWTHEENSLFLMADVDSAREEVEFVTGQDDKDYPDDDFRGEWLHVNCHGNATLYCRGDDGKNVEIWSLV